MSSAMWEQSFPIDFDEQVTYYIEDDKFIEFGQGIQKDSVLARVTVTWWDYSETGWKSFLNYCQTGKYPDA